MKTRFHFKQENKITVLSGAGISAESGIKTFRDHDGLWENHDVEDVASPFAFQKNPAFVWKFYKQRFFQLLEVKPNAAHFALKKMEDFFDSNFQIITQNVDGLHYSAGNKNVLEMHGTLRKCYCTVCFRNYKMEKIDLKPEIPICPHCKGYLRPDIVWFGETPYQIEKIYKILEETDYFMIIGTSGLVYPAAQLLSIALYYGACTIGINLEKPANMKMIEEFHQGKAGEILPELIEEWIK